MRADTALGQLWLATEAAGTDLCPVYWALTKALPGATSLDIKRA
jgi:hypothetical protein